ncbi:site-specific integrase [Aquabacterium sp.]|uniref:tyrosine-type recombinase/integrase n=1 Tax=Aquabacterium sp. TaxID=1872578 RepID=UPI00248A7781|nr:site-specific integrase [Aquabacterium sp.]MDI1259584.1 site-specific integrase [Aquabacterium sp.]
MTDTKNTKPTRFKFTRESVDAAQCQEGKSQSIYWDTMQTGLGLRVTAHGARAFIFEAKLGRQTIRMTIGAASMPIRVPKDKKGNPTGPGADGVAAEYSSKIKQGIDPRQEKAATIATDQADRAAVKVGKQRLEVIALTAWADYCKARRRAWSERNYTDHIGFVSPGGEKRKRAKGDTIPGPLHSLLNRPLAQIDSEAVRQWVEREAKTRPARALLGFRLLRAFINWCAEDETYAPLVQPEACKPKKTRQALPKVAAKDDCLQREQLALWFAEVRKQSNPIISAYLQALLITGARREELLGLQWSDVDFQWQTLTIRDKVDGERTIPLTPFVAQMLAALPRRMQHNGKPNPWVFSSPQAESGHLQDPRINHNKALQAAGLPHLTLHGLRRSFGTLSEWCEVPVGIVAQIQGHKPSAIAEKHYRVRPIDLLRQWHAKIEAWMLEQAGIEFDAGKPNGLHVVTAA